jgi:hypothetical protein
MARKRGKEGRPKTASPKRRTAKAVKNPRQPASKSAAPKAASSGAIDLLRSWSPSRYSTR